MFQGRLKDVFRKFSRKIEEYFKGGVFQEYFEEVQRVFQGSFKDISGKFQGVF